MNPALREMIRTMLLEGKRAPEIRSALLEHDVKLEDHYSTYYELLDRLDLKEDIYANQQNQAAVDYRPENRFDAPVIIKGLNLLAKTVLVLVGLVLVVILLTGQWRTVLNWIGVDNDEVFEGMTAEDIARQKALDTLAWSADNYKKKLLDYQGVCQSIGIDHNKYNCADTPGTFVIEVPMSTGDWYCVDNTDFAGVVTRSFGRATQCSQ